jgi:shikimate dehydrogenase
MRRPCKEIRRILMQRKFAILGFPLKHTMSPPIHKRLFELDGKDGEYLVYEISPEDLEGKMPELNALDGYNVTIPHKISVIQFLDRLDETAKRYGAVNCIANKNGELVGFNTDCLGFLRALESADIKLGGKVLLLGCGGAGRMMAIEAALSGAELSIAVRKGYEHEAQKVISEIREMGCKSEIKILTLGEIDGAYDLLLNATPVGMYPHIDECPVPDEVIRNCTYVFDAVYNPVKTKLLQKAAAFGKKSVGGMAMLVWQAVAAHEIWDNSSYKISDVEDLILKMEKQVMENFK